jgi:hypothetical protein
MNIITVLYYFLKFALRDRKLKVILACQILTCRQAFDSKTPDLGFWRSLCGYFNLNLVAFSSHSMSQL